MNKIQKNITFIGSGNMAEAIISGLLGKRYVQSNSITVTDIRKERLSYLKNKFQIKISFTNIEAVNKADIIILSVKPQQIEEVIKEISSKINKRHIVVSIAAGITTKFIEKLLPKGIPVIRIMPNTPALVGAGAIAISKGKFAGASEMKLANKLFSSSGIVIELPEAKIDAVTALSGSGPAYIFYLSEILERTGIDMGLSKDISKILSRQTIYGAGKMLIEQNIPSEELKRKVTSPGGTTEAALKFLESNSFAEIFEQAVKRAMKRAKELARK